MLQDYPYPWVDINIRKPDNERPVFVYDFDNDNIKISKYVGAGWDNIYTTVTHWCEVFYPKHKPMARLI